MNALTKVDLIDLYYPTDETIAAILTVPREQREGLLHRILAGASEATKNSHVSRILAIVDAFSGIDRS